MSDSYSHFRIVSTGSYVPEKVLTNADLEAFVDTTDEWIQSRTGIKARRIAAEGESTSDLASEAGKRALEAAGIAPEKVDLIIVATITPDMFFPSTSCFVQAKIGAKNAIAFDVSAACSGFLFALTTARHYLNSGNYQTALIIGAEKLSSLINWEDRSTCVLFGDGAGAAVLQYQEEEGCRVLASNMGSDGTLADILKVPGGGAATPITPENVAERPNSIVMEGQEVFKQAVSAMLDAGTRALEEAGLTTEDLDHVIAHQANRRIIEAITKRMKIPAEKTFINLDKYGNTSAASVGIALDEANRTGVLKKGDKILLVAFGAGLTWAATIIEW